MIDRQLRCSRQSGDTETQFRLGDYGNPNLAYGNSQKPFSNLGKVSFDHVADGVGIEKIANRHLEQIALLWRRVLAVGQEVARHFDRGHQSEQVFP